jgi:hypothetical protein
MDTNCMNKHLLIFHCKGYCDSKIAEEYILIGSYVYLECEITESFLRKSSYEVYVLWRTRKG